MNSATTKTNLGTCGKCNGKGRIAGFSHYAGGVCFWCSGTGRIETKTTSADRAHASVVAVWDARFDALIAAIGRNTDAGIVARECFIVAGHFAGWDAFPAANRIRYGAMRNAALRAVEIVEAAIGRGNIGRGEVAELAGLRAVVCSGV